MSYQQVFRCFAKPGTAVEFLYTGLHNTLLQGGAVSITSPFIILMLVTFFLKKVYIL